MIGLAAIILFVLIMTVVLKTQKKKFQKLRDLFQGSYSHAGQLSFSYKGSDLLVRSIGVQNFHAATSGSYYTLDLRVNQPMDFYLGPKKSYRYKTVSKIPEDFSTFVIKVNNNEQKEFLLKNSDVKTTQKTLHTINEDEKSTREEIQRSIDLFLELATQFNFSN